MVRVLEEEADYKGIWESRKGMYDDGWLVIKYPCGCTFEFTKMDDFEYMVEDDGISNVLCPMHMEFLNKK